VGIGVKVAGAWNWPLISV